MTLQPGTVTAAANQWVNVRQHASTAAPIVGQLRPGASVQYDPAPRVGGWYLVGDRAFNTWYALDNGFVAEKVVTIQPAPSAFRLVNPVGCESVISSRFGVRRDYDGDGIDDDIHEGLDITRRHADCTPLILNGADGVVMDASSAGSYGNHVVVSSVVGGQEWRVWYAHMAQMFVSKGQVVKAGAVIGVMGSSGNSSGVHLHLSLQKIGAPTPQGSPLANVVDPEPLVEW